MNNKLSKALIKHCNMQFLALKGFINKIQFFLKIPYILKFLHKPLHNDIKKIIKKIEENFELKKRIF
jgi:hypothetical protein